MRALAILRLGDRPSVQEISAPPADDATLIRVTYAGVNPVDYKRIDQLNAASAFPFVVGLDFAGIIERVSADRPDLNVGDRVFGIARAHGSYAQYTAVSSHLQGDALVRIPPGVRTTKPRHCPYRELRRSDRSSGWTCRPASAFS
jgi:NADPH2:quinone reductase